MVSKACMYVMVNLSRRHRVLLAFVCKALLLLVAVVVLRSLNCLLSFGDARVCVFCTYMRVHKCTPLLPAATSEAAQSAWEWTAPFQECGSPALSVPGGEKCFSRASTLGIGSALSRRHYVSSISGGKSLYCVFSALVTFALLRPCVRIHICFSLLCEGFL